jgi:protein O-GlcNAc transferase
MGEGMMNRHQRRMPARNRQALQDQAFKAAHALHQQGRLAEAEAGYRLILQENPRHVNAVQFMGLLLYDAGHFDQAVALLSIAVELDPSLFTAHANLALAMKALGGYCEAIDSYERALAAGAPAKIWSNVAETLRELGLHAEGVKAAEQAQAGKLSPEDRIESESKLLYIKSYGALSPPDEALGEAVAWYERTWKPCAPQMPVERDPHRRLRIGFVSANLRFHVIAQCIEATLDGFKARDDVETIAYSSTTPEDSTTQRLKGKFDQWRAIRQMSDEAAAEQIRRDKVDILLDLSGRTGGRRLGIFALRPAPIQAGYIGPIATSGMPIDYFIGDSVICPEDTIEKGTEEFFRLPRCYMTYRPLEEAPPVAPPPSGPITFGSFNALAKLSPATINLWSKVLRAIPDSRLLLKANGLQEEPTQRRLLAGFNAEGIDSARIDFLGQTPFRGDHLSTYSRIHIALDPTPFSGGATTQEALWMGVPVVTLAGDRMIGRWSASLLTAAGFPDWVAGTPEGFVNRAHRLAHSDLAPMRMQQREKVAASELCDGAGMAQALADAFRQMWHRYLKHEETT